MIEHGRWRFGRVGAVVAAVMSFALPAALVAAEPEGEVDRPRTALVLSGGGARGAAHVGVLKVMEELRIPIDFVVGTSMGSIVGGLYASGVSPEVMEQKFKEIDWEGAFDDYPPRKYNSFRRKEDSHLPLFKLEMGWGLGGFSSPSGLVAGQKLNFLLRSMLIHASEDRSFDELPIPYRAVAADLVSGQMVVLDSGDLAKSIRASMAYPVVFTPVAIDGMILVDGGVVRNLPVDVALDWGADRIIVVDVSSPWNEIEKSGSALKVMQRTMSLMAKQNLFEQRELIRDQDLLLTPELDGVVTFLDFANVGPAIERGERIAREHEVELRRFSVSEAEFARFVARQRSGTEMGEKIIAGIDIRGVTRVAPRQILGRVETAPGTPVDLKTLSEDLTRVHQIGEFQTVEFRFEDDGEELLVIDATEKPWGPWYFRIGAAIEADFEGQGAFTGLALIRRAQFNALGAEWRTTVGIGDHFGFNSEFFQPVTYSGRFFLAPRARLLRSGDQAVIANDERFFVDRDDWGAGFDLGAQFGNYGEIRLGVERGEVLLDDISGSLDRIDAETGGWGTKITLDVLDNANFPEEGTFAQVDLFVSRDDLGADDEFERLELRATHAFDLDSAGTLLASVRFGSALGSDLPVYDAFLLGGFLNLSGLARDELIGDTMGLGRLAYYRKVGNKSALLGQPYAGLSLETGNVWTAEEDASVSDLRYSGSLFVGTDTVLGPFYLAYGRSEGGFDKWYVFLGRIF